MRSTSLLRFLLAASVAACASANQQTAAPQRTTYGEVGVVTVDVHPTDATERTVIHSPAGAVYGALRGVYTQQLGVTLSQDDSAAGQIASRQARATRTIGEKPMSAYFDCGLSQIGPRADHSSILLQITSQVQAFGKDSAGVATTVYARAQDPGTSTDPVSCESTGELEKYIANMTRLRLVH